MSDETPQSDDTPTVPSAPVEPAAPTPTPTPEPTPEPVAAASPAAGAESDPPAAPGAAGAGAPPAAPVAAPVAASAAAPERRGGFYVPKWVAIVVGAVVAALVFGGIGYAIGDSSGGSDSRNAVVFPGNGNGGRNLPGYGPLGGLGNGNGPLGGQGNGSPGNGNGTGGGTQTNGAFLGVALSDATNGAQITAVKSGSPAANAGLQNGDVVTAVDGTSITSAAALVKAVQSHSSGDKVTITYTRNGNSATANVTLGSRSAAQSS